MVNKKTIVLLTLVTSLSLACSNTSKKPNVPFVDGSSEQDDNTEIVIVPYIEKAHVRTVQVKINSCSEFPMIFDTGCSGLSISILEVYTLAKQGCITADDIEGFGYSTIADGSIVENMIINLKHIQIGDLHCKNVKAMVSDNVDAPILLGNGVLNQVTSFEINNLNKTIKFHLK